VSQRASEQGTEGQTHLHIESRGERRDLAVVVGVELLGLAAKAQREPAEMSDGRIGRQRNISTYLSSLPDAPGTRLMPLRLNITERTAEAV
jgi:hypothetical protein